jgi:DNA-binding XRE family transcriptional regulator
LVKAAFRFLFGQSGLMTHNIPPDFSQRIQQLRVQASLTQTGLASLIGVTPAAVNRWASGEVRPSAMFWRQTAGQKL